MDIRNRVIHCTAAVLKKGEEEIERLPEEESLSTVGVDSINFVEIVVSLEEEFHIIFEDEELLLQNLDTMKKLCAVIAGKVENAVA